MHKRKGKKIPVLYYETLTGHEQLPYHGMFGDYSFFTENNTTYYVQLI